MNVVELLHARAVERPDSPAIIETRGKGTQMSFSDLDKRAARAAALLHSYGLRAGEAVLIVHPMSAQLYVALAAVFRLGAIAMFIDPSADSRIIDGCCELRRPRAYFSSPSGQLLRLRSAAIRRIALNFCTSSVIPGAIPWDRANGMAPLDDVFAAGADTPALLTFTSGSTGAPKAALRTHGVLRAQLDALRAAMRLTASEVDLTTMPIVLLANLACGVTSVISGVDLSHPGEVDSARVFADTRGHHATSATASPAFFQRLADYCALRGVALPELRKVFCGGAPVFAKTLDAIKQVAPHSDPCAVYGSTEAEPIAHLNLSEIGAADRAAMRCGAGLLAGFPVGDVQLCIIASRWGTPIPPLSASEFAAASLPPREPGEIVVSGPHVVPGYLGGHGDEESKFRVEKTIWHRTGDSGYVDERGRLWLLGRCGARIDDGLGTLYPFSVETAVSDVAGLRRSAALSVDGRRVLAIEADAASQASVKSELQRDLQWARIADFRFLDRIPVDRRHNAKIDYPALKKLL